MRAGWAPCIARDSTTTEQPVAVKVLHHAALDTAGDRFAREAEVLASLDHPHVVKYVAHGVDAENAGYLAIEWLEGHDLDAHLEQHPRLGVVESIALVRAVADALSVAHARGIVHRDIKPSNLFLEGGELARVKVLDFGVARLENNVNATRTGTALGTPGYMAPEQARGERFVDAADVFALGCVLWNASKAGRPRVHRRQRDGDPRGRCSSRRRRWKPPDMQGRAPARRIVW